MAFVLDASIAAAWFLPDEQHDAADRLMAELRATVGLVPASFWFETRNLFLVAERRGRCVPFPAFRSASAARRRRQATTTNAYSLLKFVAHHLWDPVRRADVDLAFRHLLVEVAAVVKSAQASIAVIPLQATQHAGQKRTSASGGNPRWAGLR
ncbi:type II toxin-antitoxin system VapC family toxin [Ensifer adhaerens]|uniref:type II toxin-antitoxin system VapC family toxin n=1 Tax=Ensifer adhaerens TaxID=106592 RepID=UPI001CBB464F|nr:type II toxin-antitoxin system VapC family toxin [Ensifer adhaerens]MBZ7927065.1 type II toxin-antitoxin system VapC family toxin [Ensifer adhaerens]